jgi:two-component system sensor histidine kinase UhpB
MALNEQPQGSRTSTTAPEGRLLAGVAARNEAERRRLARFLHDEVSGMLAAARMDVAWLTQKVTGPDDVVEHLERLDRILDQVIRATRHEMQALRPALLDHFGLVPTLEHYVREFGRTAGIPVALELPESIDNVEPDLLIAAFRVVQQLLGDDKLAECAVRLRLTHDSGELEIRRRWPEEVVPEAREEVDALRTWLQVLGGSWTESRGDDESITRLSLPRAGR